MFMIIYDEISLVLETKFFGHLLFNKRVSGVCWRRKNDWIRREREASLSVGDGRSDAKRHEMATNEQSW